MATIPQVRVRLAAVAIWAEEEGYPDKAAEIDEIVQELHRRPSVRRAPAESTPMTEALANAICAYKAAYPRASYKKIGDIFGVNTGRVSEALRGKRT